MEYQLGLLARLTDEVRHTEDEDSSVTQIVLNTAPFREKTLAFNYASLALNNSFFLSHLTPNPAQSHEAAISPELHSIIRTDHGGLENFKSTVSAAAMGMFTSGYVWFVSDRYGSTSILPTLGPGTLLVRSRTYMAHAQPELFLHDAPAHPLAWDPEMQYTSKYLGDWRPEGLHPSLDPKQLARFLTGTPEAPQDPPFPARGPSPLRPRFLHTSARHSRDVDSRAALNGTPDGLWAGQSPRPPPKSKVDALHAGEVLFPLFCVAVQEHAWISAGYGIWGKEAWLREFWSVLNWERVSEAYKRIRSTTGS